MPQKKKYVKSAEDTVFDFIFSSAKKNIRPSKPIEPSEATGNELADGLAEVAMMPASYVRDNVFTPIGQAFDRYTVAELNEKAIPVHGKDRALRMRVRGSKFADFLTDPESFAEKAFEDLEESKKNARRMNMIRGVGGIMDMAVGAIVVKKLASSDPDLVSSAKALKIGSELGNEYMSEDKRNDKGEHLAASASVFETFKDEDLDLEKTEQLSSIFYDALDSVKVERAGGLSRQDTAEEIKKRTKQFTRKTFSLTDVQIDRLVENHLSREEMLKTQRNVSFAIDGSLNLGIMDRDNPQDKGLTFADVERDFDRAKDPANKFRAIKYDNLKARRDFYNEKANRRRNQLIASGVINFTTDSKYKFYSKKREEVNREIGILRIWQRSKGSDMKFSRFFGEATLQIETFQNMLGPEGGLYALATGKWWDDDFNIRWNPSKETNFEMKLASGENFKHDNLKVAKKDTRGAAAFMGLYYLTPGSIGRTLFVNGEWFVYRAYLKEKNILEHLRANSDSVYRYIDGNRDAFRHFNFFKDGSGRELFGDRNKIIEATMKNYSDVLETLKRQADGGHIPSAQLEYLVKRLELLDRKLKNSKGLKYSRALQKIWATIDKYNPKKLLMVVFAKTLKAGLTAVVGKKLASKATKVLLGGRIALRKVIKQGVKAAVHAIAQALGLAVGGVANALIFVLTEVVIWLSEKLLKPVVKIATLIFWGILIVFILILVSPFAILENISAFSGKYVSQHNIGGIAAPIYCQECEGDYEIPDLGPPPPWDGSNCPFGSGLIHCSQGTYTGASHSSRNAIDTTNAPGWWAPTDGEIRRVIHKVMNSRIPSQACGGWVDFHSHEYNITHTIVHITPSPGLHAGKQVKQGDFLGVMSIPAHGNVNFIPFSVNSGTCTTGIHFHDEFGRGDIPNPGYNLLDFYNTTLNCNIQGC
jgi:hypothetical protein